ncbi:ORF2 [Jasmine virus A-1]|nr:ORF2 [Jasmine virus A-1]
MDAKAGLDFGTTFSTISAYVDGVMRVLTLNSSEYIPTCLSILASGDVVIGDAARVIDASTAKHCYFYDLKRWVGVDEKIFKTIHAKIQPLYVAELRGTEVYLTGISRGFSCTYTVKQLILLFVDTIVRLFSKTNALNIVSLNVSVPADYKCRQRMFMRSVCDSLSFSLRRIINEPSAAAIYNVSKYANFDSFLMYDFGGGTFDTSLIVRDGKYVTVADTEGDSFLGGRDIDNAISAYIMKKNNLTAALSSDYLAIIKEECNTLGKTLFNAIDIEGKLHSISFSLSDLEFCARPFIDRSLKILDNLVKRRNLTSGALFLVGGSSLLKCVQDSVSRYARDHGLTCIIDKELRNAVSFGCSMQHAQEDSGSMVYIDCNSHPLTDLLVFCNPRVLIRKPMSIPYTFTTSRVVTSHYNTAVNVYEGSDLFVLNNDWLVSADVRTRDHVAEGETLEFIYRYNVDGIVELSVRNKERGTEKVLPNSFSISERIQKLDLNLTQLSNVDEYVTLLAILSHFRDDVSSLLSLVATPTLFEREFKSRFSFDTLYTSLKEMNKNFS